MQGDGFILDLFSIKVLNTLPERAKALNINRLCVYISAFALSGRRWCAVYQYPGCRFALPRALRLLGFQPVFICYAVITPNVG